MTLTDDIRAAAARVAAEATSVRIIEAAIEPYARELARRVAARARPRAAPTTRRAPRSACSSTRSTSAPAGSRRSTSRRASPASGRSRRACAPAARGRAEQLTTITRAEIADDARPGPRARADGPFRAPPARARAAGRRRARRLVPDARPRRRRLVEALATELAHWPTWYDISPYPSGEVPFFKRAQIAAADLALAGLADAPRPRPADAVRRQPRPPRAADRRRARVRRRPRGPDRRRARCSSTTRPRRSRSAPARCTRSSCSSPRTRQHDRDRVDNVLWNRGAAPALQGAPAPPRADDRLLSARPESVLRQLNGEIGPPRPDPTSSGALEWSARAGARARQRGLILEVPVATRARQRGRLCAARRARTQRRSRSTTTRPTARQPPSRRSRPRSTPPQHGDTDRRLQGRLRRGHRRARHQRADDHQEHHAQGRRRRPRVDHAEGAPLVGGSILEATSDIRNGVGDIVAVVGTPTQPLTVNISGVTVDGYDPQGREVAVEAGILFLDAKGSIVRSRVTNVVTSEGDNAYTARRRLARPAARHRHRADLERAARPRGRRAQADHRPHPRRQVQQDRHPDRRRAERRGAVHRRPARSTGASSPPARSSAAPSASTTPAPAAAPSVGLLTTGPLFGQDGLRVTSGSYATVDSSLISQNLVNGTGAPTRNSDDQQREPDARRGRPLRRREDRRSTRARPARSSTRGSHAATSSTTPTA